MIFKQQKLTPAVPKNIETLIPVHKPTWGAEKEDTRESIKVTWLGHAACLAEFPTRTDPEGSPSPSRGIRILFDPAMSDRCSPFQWIGPKRFTPTPCDVAEIPTIDAVVISHDHYDHLDTNSIQSLAKREPKPHFFAPLGNGPWFRSMGIPESHTHILDWWDSRRLEVDVSGTKLEVDITCTPCQHFSGRSVTSHLQPDKRSTLWSSWAVEEVTSNLNPKKLWFGGDTGYRAVLSEEDEEKAETCPAFKEIGQKFGYFDVALIPIGAYLGRRFMSPIHCAPQDSVHVFQDVRAKRALGIHWGAWQLTHEDVDEPPRKLVEEAKKIGLEENAFVTCEIGQTLFF